MLNPDTGYLDFDDEFNMPCDDERDGFGITKAFVCFNKERSLHKAEMRGKSRCLLFSRRILMSICCCCKLMGVCRSLFDSGHMTCDNFKSFKSIGFELDDDVVVLLLTSASAIDIFGDESIVVRFVEDFDCDFIMDEVEEDFSVDGFAGTTRKKNKSTVSLCLGIFHYL